MRALITGANGFVGIHLAQRLAGRGDFVRCLLRPGREVPPLEGRGFEWTRGDVCDRAALREAVRGVDVVFHLAGIRRSPERADFFRVNSEGTRNVCEAMVADGGPRRLVLCGSLAASGPSQPERPRQEEDPFQPEEWYGQSKAQAEQIAFSYSGRLEVTCARPPRIVGPGDRENLPFFRLVGKGLNLRIGGGPRPLSMVDVEDVVTLLVLLADRPEAVGHAFFAGGEITTLEAMQAVIADHLGVRPRTLFMPPLALKGLARVADAFSSVSGKHLPLNRKLARQLLAPAWTCSTAKAERMLGYRPAHPIDDSIRRSAAWYQARGLI